MGTEFTPEQMKGMKTFEALMQLKDLKPGDVITDRQCEALENLIGDALDKVREMKPTVATIKFKDGKPYTTDGNPLGITIDGKTPPDINEEKKND